MCKTNNTNVSLLVSDMFERFLTIIKTDSLIEPSDKVLLAVSGGLDSMVLWSLFRRVNYNFGICHINYGLRGEDSEADETLVSSTAHEDQCAHHFKRVAGDAWLTKQSVQMRAREIRYKFFEEVVDEFGYDIICTAHHLNDNLETVLLNFVKGTGISGLTGMDAKRGNIVRPLLSFTKQELKSYAIENGVAWREDQSNTTSKYQRNLIRNEVVPLLKKLNPALEDSFLKNVGYLQGAEQALKASASEIRQANFVIKKDYRLLQLDWFDQSQLNEAILYELLKEYGLNSDQLADLIQAIFLGKSGKIFETPTHQILLDRHSLMIQNANEKKELIDLALKISDHKMTLPKGTIHLNMIQSPITIIKDRNRAYLNKGKLNFPLRLRNWERGDWFVPFGMKGKKLISDFMIDLKIPLSLKKDILVLVSGEDIVWVVGYRIDDRYKMNSQTTELLMLEYETF